MDRDARLQSSKAELVQARRDLQEKDEELRSAYAHMTKACEQRAAVRAALIGTQTELAETQAELDAWTHELATFQEDMANSLVRHPDIQIIRTDSPWHVLLATVNPPASLSWLD